MPVQITSQGKILNQQVPTGEAIENRDFMYQTIFVPAGAVIEWAFSLEGQPGDLEIDDQTGVITGNVKSLNFNGKGTGKQTYPEFDYRKHEDVTPSEQTYDFTFNILCEGKDQNGPQTVPWQTQSSVTITIIKDFQVNPLLFQEKFLEGDGARAPYTCQTQYPTTEVQCQKIGGVWDGSQCSINIPETEEICSSVGGLWENGKCNMQMINNQNDCESCGHLWVKNNISGNETLSSFISQNNFDSETLEIYNEVK